MTEGIEYEFEVREKPTFSYIEVAMKKGQEIQCEGGTMIFFDPTLEISTKKATKGFLKSLKRVLAGETFFKNTFTALDDGSLGLAPAFPGDLMHIPLFYTPQHLSLEKILLLCAMVLFLFSDKQPCHKTKKAKQYEQLL